MIPTRQQIQEKILEIRNDPTFSTIKIDFDERIREWLTEIGCPKTKTITGEVRHIHEDILSDLSSYKDY